MDELGSRRHDQFLRLYTAHEPAIRAFVRRLVPTRADAADVIQDVVLVLWRKFDGFDSQEDFRRWAFGVARYETLAWLRDKARDRHVLAEDVLELLADEAVSAEPRLSAQREALEQCLAKLPMEQRSLVIAAYAPGARIEEIAERSGRTIGGFYQWLHRMRMRLLECTRRVLAAEGISW
jgi:RNA polymerase sigma-70 factor (ECF subfamily)